MKEKFYESEAVEQLVLASWEMYRVMPGDAFCTSEALRAKNEFRAAMKSLFPGQATIEVVASLKESQKSNDGTGCGRRLADGQYWTFCGETDMGQTQRAICQECGGTFRLTEGAK